ncbi:chromate resistance protein [Tropicibacter sp. R16_0]|uniref:chromate resistance protein ChrB domain-containing protein n=1 Tax=Tropicibacter sp. R16_0 TaxID=2821102 RepID=UPI001ADC61C7|nr:chromate resistance protein ChrB domain-containing protein [Tropicibacter sp. R16_0]MBO9449624.1 chromate resistance protein [Tropicibacter sp. R16_0]
MPAFNSVSPNVLMRRIGTPDCPVIIDVRIDADFDDDPHLIPSSFRWPRARVEELSSELRGKDVVVVCQKGLKLSHGAAAILRCTDVNAQVLQGGMFAWRDTTYPTVNPAVLPAPKGGQTTWVTRHRPKVDRIACAWLIRRFVDTNARFLFVPPSEVDAVAEKFGATAFDTVNAPWTHEGELCTFDVMVRGFGLQTPALEQMATVVRAADTDRHELAPQAAGLLAISVGLSRAHKSDLEQLDAGMILYDALYRWARDGQGEQHTWSEGHGA